MLKAQGMKEFIEDADARAVLVQLTNDTASLVHRMTRKLAGHESQESPSASSSMEGEE
jgi:hypothetical protein